MVDDARPYTSGAGAFPISADEINDANQAKDTEWLQTKGGVQQLVNCLHSDAHHGINTKPTDYSTSLEQRVTLFGANRYQEIPPKSFLRLWLEALKDPIVLLLIAAALISTILGVAVPKEREENAWIEGIAIWVAVGVVTLVGALQDWHKNRQFAKLNQQNNAIDVKVVRDGVEQVIPNTDIVVGDVLLLETGDKVTADGVYLHGYDLVIDESSLTGEADPIKKNAQDPWCRSGTSVSEGSGRILVVAVGPSSEWGRTLALVVKEPENTPLQDKLWKLAKIIGAIGLATAVVCFIALMIRWMIVNRGFPISKFSEGPLAFFTFSVTIVVVAVPEGLPLAVTISLAYSMKKMMKDKNFVRHLAACETMGGATAICSDKTGTLTENRMTVTEAWFCGKRHTELPTAAALPASVRSAVEINCAVNSKAFLVEQPDQPIQFVGNRTECALLVMIKWWGVDYTQLRDLYEADIIKLFGFSSERKMASVLLKTSTGGARLYNKGASEIVVGRCTHWLDQEGQRMPLTEEQRRQLLNSVTAMASCGLRTLGLAYRDWQVAPLEEQVATPPEDDLTLLCVLGIKDPLRAEVPEAVNACKKAGITVRMVTGDNIHTARNIARECGILTQGGLALEGPKFREMPEEEVIPLLPKLQVLARSSPQDKHTLVNLLKRQGEVVGVTGDGTNDAPALKEADVGLAMGIAGTEVAKEAADIVILDDNFSSIVKAVMWGRNTFASIRKFLQFQLTVNVVALVVAFVAAITDGATPLNILQLLWVNLIMDSMGALALATEPPTSKLLDEKPYGRKEHLVNGRMMKHILSQAAYQAFWCFLIFYGLPRHFDAYALPNECPYYSDTSLSGNPVNLCDPSIYAQGQTPICVPQSDGGCTIKEPGNSNSTLSTWYSNSDNAYDKALKEARKHTNSVVFNTFIFCQIFNMFNARKVNDELNVFENIHHSPLFWIMLVIMCGAQVIIVETPLNSVFKIDRQTWEQWLIAIAIGAGSLLVSVVVKLITYGVQALRGRTAAESQKGTAALPPTTSAIPMLQRNASGRSQVSIAVSAGREDTADIVDGQPAEARSLTGSRRFEGGPVLRKSTSRNSSIGGSRRWEVPVLETASPALTRNVSKNGSRRWDGEVSPWDEESKGSRRFQRLDEPAGEGAALGEAAASSSNAPPSTLGTILSKVTALRPKLS